MTNKKSVEYSVKTPTSELPSLWQKGFFSQWRSASEVVDEFAKSGFHFKPSALSKALSRAPFITPKGKGKGSSISYIQAYPFSK